MKKLLCIVISILLCTALFACDGKGNKANNKDGGNTPVSYDDGTTNVFSLSKESADGDVMTVKLSVGGEQVKLSGFQLTFEFDAGMSVVDVEPLSGSESMSFNGDESGRLTLVWAVTKAVTKKSDICKITFEKGGVNSGRITGKIRSLGYYNASEYTITDISGKINAFEF